MDGREKVATEVAEEEFDRFCEAMDLDVDVSGMDDDDRKSYDEARRIVVREIVRGAATITESGELSYQPKDGGPIVFHEPTGAALLAMDTKKKSHDFAKFYAFLAAMTKQPAARFAKLGRKDVKFCLQVGALFLGG